MTAYNGAATLTVTVDRTSTSKVPRSGDATLTATQTLATTGIRTVHGAATLTILFTPAEWNTSTGSYIPSSPKRAFPTIRYPAGPITPAGGYHVLADRLPMVAYRAYDDSAVFNMMGGLAIADPTMPERVELCGLKGLVPPWKNITQKGATSDGETYVTSLYDPLEVDLTVMVRGRDPAHTRKVVRDWTASWDAKKPGTLSWYTQALGYWWADLQWAKNPVDAMAPIEESRQKFVWTGKAYNAFWRSYDSTDVFAASFRSAADTFDVDYSGENDLGPNWTIVYNGLGTGVLYADGTEANSTLVGGACAVAQRTGYVSGSDEQIVTITIGPIDPWPADTNTYVDIWARMANGGTPGQTGIRCRLGYRPAGGGTGGTGKGGGGSAGTSGQAFVRLSYFVGGVETLLREANVSVPWKPTDQISLAVGGYSGLVNSYFVQRGTNTTGGTKRVSWSTIMTVTNSKAGGDGSLWGAGYRGAGFGMEADAAVSPASIVSWTAGDSTAAEEGGYITLENWGDQDAYPYFILVGPGLFGIGDGPNATQAVVYGPLEQNQIVVIQTDPRKYGVTDLTSMPPPGVPATLQQINSLVNAFKAFNSFLSNGSPVPNLSVFGTPFPQGNPYSLLNGRFSRPVPAKSPGAPARPQQIPVAVEYASPSTAILGGLTPLRRYPQ